MVNAILLYLCSRRLISHVVVAVAVAVAVAVVVAVPGVQVNAAT